MALKIKRSGARGEGIPSNKSLCRAEECGWQEMFEGMFEGMFAGSKNPAFEGRGGCTNRDGGADGARTRDLQRDRLAL